MPRDRAVSWQPDADLTLEIPLPPPLASARVLRLQIRSTRATMLVVDLSLLGPDSAARGPLPSGPRGGAAATGMAATFVVEREGLLEPYFLISRWPRDRRPAALADIRGLRLEARDATFAGTSLTVDDTTWLDDAPLVAVSSGEVVVENFTSPRFWDPAEWVPGARHAAGPAEAGLRQIWFYAELWRVRGGPGRASFTRTVDRDLRDVQAVTVMAGTSVGALLGIRLRLDGRDVCLVEDRPGRGTGEELRFPIAGRRLEAITLELDIADHATATIGRRLTATVHWILLERRGHDPATANGVRGMPPIADPPPGRGSDSAHAARLLPVGILFGRDDLAALRARIRTPDGARIWRDIVAEAEAQVDHRPERFVGAWLPVDWGNAIGAGRMSAPMEEMRRMQSAMLYAGLVHALVGRRDLGLAARRALLAAVRCDEWANGFASRIPAGLPGYRAPFVTAHAAEAIALGYDFVHPLLSEAERQEVEDALYAKAIPWLDLYLRLHGEGYLLGSNQGPVYARGIIWAALVARRSHPDVDPLLERWTAWLLRLQGTCYRSDGSTPEGPAYWEYTTHEMVAGLLTAARHRGVRPEDLLHPNLRASIDYLLAMRSEASEGLGFLPIADGGGRGGEHLGSSLLFFARHVGVPEARWLWDRFLSTGARPPGSDAFGTRQGTYAADLLLCLLLLDGASGREPRLPALQRFAESDRVFLRAEGVTLFFEGGPQVGDHTHPDKGQFLLEGWGELLATDPGMCDYADPMHLAFKASPRHNVVTIAGRDQSYRDPQAAVVITKLQDVGSGATLLRADLRGSYRELDRCLRTILFVRASLPYLVVVDEAAVAPSGEEGGLEWNFHSRGSMSVGLGDGPQPVSGTALRVRIESPRAGMLLSVLSPQSLEVRRGVTEARTGIFARDLALCAPSASRALRIAALMAPYPAGRSGEIAVTGELLAGGKLLEEGRLPEEGARFLVHGPWGTDEVTVPWGAEPRIVRAGR